MDGEALGEARLRDGPSMVAPVLAKGAQENTRPAPPEKKMLLGEELVKDMCVGYAVMNDIINQIVFGDYNGIDLGVYSSINPSAIPYHF